jgi:periplasmic divalent cation tolerance protein
MKSPKEARIVLVTMPDRKTARKLIRVALVQRLVSCANVLPSLESHYWWKEKLEHSREVLVLFKTSVKCLKHLQELILTEHPYETPEFVSLAVDHVEKRFFDWWQANLHERRSHATRKNSRPPEARMNSERN